MRMITMTVIVLCIGRRSKKKTKTNKEGVDQEEKPQTSRCVPISSIVKGNVSPHSLDEFENLIRYDDGIGQRFTTAQGVRYNKFGQFNLIPSNLPFDHNRIKLKIPIQNCDYVNANWMTPPSDASCAYDQLIYTSYLPFNCIRFAVGQEPLPRTLDHHFRMVHECKFDIVVSFTMEPSNKPFEVGKMYRFEGLTLNILNRIKINDSLHRTEFSLVNDDENRDQYKHTLIHFEFHAWPNAESISLENTEMIVSAICFIRNEMTLKQSSLSVLVTDFRGGVAASAVFLALYEAMQEVDEAFTHDNQLKKSVNDIDVFAIVNRLRKDRDRMVEDYATYKALFRCLGYYGLHRVHLNQLGRKYKIGETNEINSERLARTTTGLEGGSRYDHDGRNNSDQEGVYVIDEMQRVDNTTLDESYNFNISDHHRYQNIEAMSEYI